MAQSAWSIDDRETSVTGVREAGIGQASADASRALDEDMHPLGFAWLGLLRGQGRTLLLNGFAKREYFGIAQTERLLDRVEPDTLGDVDALQV